MKIVYTLVLASLTFAAAGSDSITAPAAKQEESCRIVDGGFEEGLTHWILKCHDGAEGKAEIVENGRHGKALKLTKLNGEGFLQLVSREPIPFRAGRKMTLRGFYRSENSPLSTLLLFRLTPSSDDGRWVYDDIDRSFGFTSQSMLLNAAPGVWNKRVISRQSAVQENLYCNVLMVGNPAEVVLDDLELEDFKKFRRPQPADLEKRTTFPYTEEQVYEILAKRKAPEARLEKRGSKVVMLLNGEEVPPVLYKSESFYDDYVLKISPEKMHDLEANAKFMVAEGATMASEAFVLGVPYLYLNPLMVGYIDYQCTHYPNRCFKTTNGDEALKTVKQLIDLKIDGEAERRKVEEQTINPTDYLVKFVEDYQ